MGSSYSVLDFVSGIYDIMNQATDLIGLCGELSVRSKENGGLTYREIAAMPVFIGIRKAAGLENREIKI